MSTQGPVVMTVKPGRYVWCTCGQSTKQPFCDGSHGPTGTRPMFVEIPKKKKSPGAPAKKAPTNPFAMVLIVRGCRRRIGKFVKTEHSPIPSHPKNDNLSTKQQPFEFDDVQWCYGACLPAGRDGGARQSQQIPRAVFHVDRYFRIMKMPT